MKTDLASEVRPTPPHRYAMTLAERDELLEEQRTCRVATANSTGRPHVSPLWYVWDGQAMWLYSVIDSLRERNLAQNPRVAVVVDAGEAYGELRGVEFSCRIEFVGDTPRLGAPVPELESVEAMFSTRYRNGKPIRFDGRHRWLRLVPESEYTWDFRKRQRQPESRADS